MRIDADLLKDILEKLADSGYSPHGISSRQIEFEGVPRDKLDFHVAHLINDDYLDGMIRVLEGNDGQVIRVHRITDKGMLMLSTIENNAFQEWVKEKSGKAADALWKTGAGIMWAYAKQWLVEKGVVLPGS